MKSPAIVLHGTSSAGKSSLARALQDCAPLPAFHIEQDAFVTMSRRRDMRSIEEQREAYRLHFENLKSTLARLAKSQFEIILDTVLREGSDLDDCLSLFGSRPLYVIRVWAPLEVLELREKKRGDRRAGLARTQFDHPGFKRDYELAIDTSIQSPAEGAAVIRSFIGAHQQLASR